ncbi:MAG TPA: asparagine synthase C-terminal domain-containing protein, partial [Vicinamibacterales bacterium]
FWEAQYPLEDEGDGRAGEFRGSPAEAALAVRDALEEAVSLRILRADVPVGSYLSGGLDSSLVAALGLRAKQEKFHTYSIRFEDAEYDETEYQRAMVKAIQSDHREVVVSRKDIAECFPQVIAQTERPILRTAPAPLYLLSRAVRQSGVKVVLTGEGADEMFAGYDLFREARIRRFWARRPDSKIRPRLLARLYPYLSRSPVAQQAMAREFFGANLAGWQSSGFSHGPRWRTTAAIKRLFHPELRAAIAASDQPDVVAELLGQLPSNFNRWSYLAQDQYLEVRTLLSGYLLSSQGDRMLMGHSVEGRFPFLDANVVALANALPASYKLQGLSEKHVLKRASEGLVPPEIIARKKQPYRAPDALSFVGEDAPAWIEEALDPRAVAKAGVFSPRAIEQLWAKLRARRESGQYSNSDNMAIVGVLSTQLLYRHFVEEMPDSHQPPKLTTVVDALELAGSQSTTGPGERAR